MMPILTSAAAPYSLETIHSVSLFPTSALRRYPSLVYRFETSARSFTQRVHVPNNWVLGFWVIVITVQVLGKYMYIRYLDP